MYTDLKPMDEWNTIGWKKIQRNVFKLQKRIYQAEKRADAKTVRNLQKRLLKSKSAKRWAVRRVTQENQGKNTAGIDGVKVLTAPQRMRLSQKLSLKARAKPTRRVWIPKPGSHQKRPLAIPVMADRGWQALVKIALEPQWEARFEPNSDGFRPGRSAHEAIEAILLSIKQKPKDVRDADIEKCFERIDHQRLLEKVNAFPSLNPLLKGWLKAGVMEGSIFTSTQSGTPQGGVISPLLANIALQGMEQYIEQQFPARYLGKQGRGKAQLIRYADDFLVLHEEQGVIQKCANLLETWLEEMGLPMKASKTRIVHTLENGQGKKSGFDFLGRHLRQYRVGKTHSGKSTYGHQLGFKTLIRPSRSSQRRQHLSIKHLLPRNPAAGQESIIAHLNPVITGWSRYFSTVISKQVFSPMDHCLFQALRRWTTRRHPKKSHTWVNGKYWRLEEGAWSFGTREGMWLGAYAKTAIVPHTKVKDARSPFDGDWIYWSTRLGRHPCLSDRQAFLIKRQQGKCVKCGLLFTMEDHLEVDHMLPKCQGGKGRRDNLQLLHRHCHHAKTTADRQRYPSAS
jgi:RNA-directed DNA polymerase